MFKEEEVEELKEELELSEEEIEEWREEARECPECETKIFPMEY